ncbi:hypothetical protein GCM10023188_07800 [Pontibacter saemangeumensis]|uniref:Uncharacterized protein n=1 Tax=Pontibacter saemangeumensis TaxID=1084525 RepID=A0ABP8LAN9_9BACT
MSWMFFILSFPDVACWLLLPWVDWLLELPVELALLAEALSREVLLLCAEVLPALLPGVVLLLFWF